MRTVTLLTDFGNYYAAQVKGVLAGAADIIDITHDVRPHKDSVIASAYMLSNIANKFPKGTIHIAIVDPGVGSQRQALAIETKNYWFIGPDNGLLVPAAEKDGIKQVFSISIAPQSRTFHGKDVFAPAAVEILKGNAKILKKTKNYYKLDLNNKAFINRFGNVELPISDEIIAVNGRGIKNYNTYSEAEDGELFSVIDSRGLRELAVRESSASRKLGKKITVRTKKKLYSFDLVRLGV